MFAHGPPDEEAARLPEDLERAQASSDVVWGDVRDRASVADAVRGMEAVIHTVSNFRSPGSDRDEAFEINVEGTRNVLEASVEEGVERFVHCSTIGVHGDVREIPATEDTPFHPGDTYQETKAAAERYVRKRHEETGCPITVIRPISMFGPGDRRMLKLFRMIEKGWFPIVGDGKVLFQPAYVDDVVEGFLLALELQEAVGEVFIVGSDQHLELNDLVRLIAEELGTEVRTPHVPLGPVLAAARACELLCAPLGIDPPLHRRRVSFYQNNRAFSIEKARRVLGHEPRHSLREGLRRTIGWYREHGWL